MKKLLILLVAIATAITGLVYWLHSPSAMPAPGEYTYAAVEFGSITETVNATGRVQPTDIAVVTSDVPGKVTEIRAEINQEVKKGAVLLRLDDRQARIQLKQAELLVAAATANLRSAEAAQKAAETAYMKQKELPPSVAIEKDLVQAKYTLDAANAAVEAAQDKVKEAKVGQEGAQLRLKLTAVEAPISGTIIDKKVYLGQPVGPVPSQQSGSSGREPGGAGSGPLFVIAESLEKLQVHAQVGEADIQKVKVKQPATFRVYAYSDDLPAFTATVKEIHPMSASVQGAVFYDVVLDADNRRDRDTREWMLRPGMTANVDIMRREHTHVWKVPAAALDFQLDEHYQTEAAKAKLADWQNHARREEWQYVWVMRDQKPWPIFVRTGTVDKAGEPVGISNLKYKEVLEWDPDLKPAPDPKVPQTFPQVITAAPAVRKSGLFDQPMKLKLS
ncbi:MAG TPA: biotin/lipoyl-binding protein [Gemmataceae bacterium]|nr:biotin/lipoyl-binding protein [Gemmataceae bacterium]